MSSTDTTIDPYPEHTKLLAVADVSRAIDEFVQDFLGGKGIELARIDRRDYRKISSMQELIAEYLGIDLAVIEDERRAMLDALRVANKEADRD